MEGRWRTWLFFSGAIFVWAVLAYVYFHAARQDVWAEVREHLMSIVQAVALSIDPEEHQRVYRERREDTPLYRKLTGQLLRFAKALLPEVRQKGYLLAQESIYTLVPSQGNIWHYVLDSGVPYDINGDGEIDDEEDKAHIGEECDVSEFPEMRRCYLEGRPTADIKPTKDKWGVWLSGYAPLRDRNGRIVAVVGVDFNITTVLEKERRLRRTAWLVFLILSTLTLLAILLFERLRGANEELREKAEESAQAKADWELTFDLIGVGVAILDENFTVVRVNKSLLQLLGKTEGELVGKKCSEVLHPESQNPENCPYEKAILSGEPVSYEVQLPDNRIWHVHARPDFVRGKVKRIIHCVQDVTAERRARRLLEQTERLITIGQMAAGVAHEINNPLNAIVGMAELLCEDLTDEQAKRMAEEIREQALRIGRITKNLLTYARPRPQELVPVDLNEVVREVLEMKTYQLRSNNISVNFKLAEPLPLVLGDRLQLQQFLLNLINNAEDAMSEQGGGTLTILTEGTEESVRLIVEDTGKGIPAEHLPHIFDPFFTTKPVGKGTGLGLAIVYGIVTGHGGKIWAENSPAGGARFIAEFPIAEKPKEEPSASQTREKPSTSQPKSPPKRRILVIDDEASIAAVLKAMLSREGHEVEVASDGAEAQRLLKEGDYDVVLCDLKMPKLSGDQIYMWLQTNKPQLVSRFIVMTGDFLSPTTQKALQEWGVPVMHKPFRMDELKAVIERLPS
ncbi:MAG: ATP-binding protein [Armatimonadetes bacterium]|nr:ATP-binding protein [Armatimonadota bacterium]